MGRVYGKVPVGKYLRMFRLPLGFLALSGLVLLWEYSGVREGILSFSVGPGYLSMTRETVASDNSCYFPGLGAVSALFALGMTTPVTELTGVLKRLHCPDLICSLMYLMYRYIFLMYQVHGNMKQAAEGRMGYMDYRTSLRTTAGIYGNLLPIVTDRQGQILTLWKAAALTEVFSSFRGNTGKTGGRQ